MDVSCWSLLDLTRRAEKLMTSGGVVFAMSYHGANEVIENYGIMGPVKAALESAARYLAAELGPKGIRVHAVSPGPIGYLRRLWYTRFRCTDGAGGGACSGAAPGDH